MFYYSYFCPIVPFVGLYVLILKMVSFFICSHRTGAALRRHRGHHQWDPDRLHHQGAPPGGLAAGPQDSRTGFRRWRSPSGTASAVFDRSLSLCTPSLSYLPAHNEISPLVTLQGAGAAVHLLRLLRVMTELAPDRVSFPQAAAARWLFVLFDWFHLGQTHLV